MQKLTNTKTPILLFSTRTGTLFNLTPVNQPKISAIQLSAGDFLHLQSTIENLPQGMTFKKFLGYNESVITYLSPYDYYKDKCMSGCQGNKVKVLGNKGYTELKAFDYWELCEKIKPDIVVSLTEMPNLEKNHKQQSNKGYKRATAKTTAFLKQICKAEKQGLLFAPIHGGKNIGLLGKSIDDCLQFDIDGFVICDLCQDETIQQRQQSYNLIQQKLKKQNKQKEFYCCLSGEGKIQDIDHALKYGITVFQVNYPFKLAQKYEAIIKKDDKFITYKPQQFEHLQPLCKQCSCHTCKNYSESYIAHLIKCYQMTGKVLLTIHNLHQYLCYYNQLE